MKVKEKVFIIDDDQMIIEVLKRILESTYNVNYAMDNKNIIDILRVEKPDIILLDILMPGDDGYIIIKEIKGVNELKDIPVIFITGLTDISEKVKAFHAGGVDYITKPFEKEEVLGRIKIHLELRRQYTVLKELNTKIHEELSLASNIQRAMMPSTSFELDGISVRTKYFPYIEIGGDFYDVIRINNGRYLVALFDVMGHGIPASLYTLMLKSELMHHVHEGSTPSDILNKIKHHFAKIVPDYCFITGVTILIDTINKYLIYANAGHPYPIYYNSKMKKITEFEKSNIMISSEKNSYVDERVDYSTGDRVIIYTDGLVDQNPKFKDYPDPSRFLIEKMTKHINQPLGSMICGVIEELSINREQRFKDDATIMAIEFT